MIPVNKLIGLIKKAGRKVMVIYQEQSFTVHIKKDKSPLTDADLISNTIIIDGLKALSKDPVLSEESLVPYRIRKNWKNFWLIDPLDGTKEFIRHNDQFTINLAYVVGKKPVLGIIYAPALDILYVAKKRGWRNSEWEKHFQ